MDLRQLVKAWFEKWETGDFQNIPVEENFKHTSPFGTIAGRAAYLDIVEANQESFLGHRFEIHDELYGGDVASVRYTSHKAGHSMEVSEWFFKGGDRIREIVSYYNVGKVSYDGNFKNPEKS